MTLAGAFLSACYNSEWGQAKRAQEHNVAISAPATLRAEDRERDGDPASPAERAASNHVQKLRVRALVTPSFTAQVVDAPRHLRDLFEDVNLVTERDLGARFVLVETRSWDLAGDDDIEKTFDALRATDAGEGVDYVAGFVGSLPRATRSFHEVGMGALVGKYVVVRAPSSAERHDAIEKSFGELPEEQRRELEKRLRRHRATAVFLHELGHTLGSVHETSPESIMFPQYNAKMSAFGASANDVMRAALAKHGASEAEVAHDVIAALSRAPDGVFVGGEREQLIAHLASIGKTAAAKDGAPPVNAPPAEPAVPETPELSSADRRRFVKAYGASASGDFLAAWNAAKPLFRAYPESMRVQDYRCQLATRTMSFELARLECAPLMKLSTQPGR
jgi:hypothetical protein